MKVRGNINTRNLARKIAADLTTNGLGQTGVRLQLRGPKEEDLGGLCIQALIDRIADVISRELKPKRRGR